MSNSTDSNNIHREIVELIPLYVSGAIEDGDRQKLELHIGDCDTCSSELKFEQSLQRSFESQDEKEIDNILERNLSLFSDRLDADTNTELPAANNAQINNIQTSGNFFSRVGDFLHSIFPSGNSALGGALAMGLAAVVGIGLISNSPNEQQILNPEEFVRSCENDEGEQKFQFTITPANGQNLESTDVSELASQHLADNSYEISSSGEDVVLTMAGEACDKRVPQLLQTLKEGGQAVGGVKLKNITN